MAVEGVDAIGKTQDWIEGWPCGLGAMTADADVRSLSKS